MPARRGAGEVDPHPGGADVALELSQPRGRMAQQKGGPDEVGQGPPHGFRRRGRRTVQSGPHVLRGDERGQDRSERARDLPRELRPRAPPELAITLEGEHRPAVGGEEPRGRRHRRVVHEGLHPAVGVLGQGEAFGYRAAAGHRGGGDDVAREQLEQGRCLGRPAFAGGGTGRHVQSVRATFEGRVGDDATRVAAGVTDLVGKVADLLVPVGEGTAVVHEARAQIGADPLGEPGAQGGQIGPARDDRGLVPVAGARPVVHDVESHPEVLGEAFGMEVGRLDGRAGAAGERLGQRDGERGGARSHVAGQERGVFGRR